MRFSIDASHRRTFLREPTRCVLLLAAGLSLSACTAGATSELAAESGASADLLLEQTTSLPEVTLPDADAAAQSPLLPVYWLGTENNLLYREFLPGDPAGDPIAAAIWAMTSAEPIDKDYYSPWQPASTVNSSISPDHVITVDIASDAFRGEVGEDEAVRAVQQFVFTATAAAANAKLIPSGSPSSVRILVDGKAGYSAFGHVELGSEFHRNAAVMAPVWIINPQDSSIRTDPTVIVQGSSTLPGTELAWRIQRVTHDGTGGSVASTGTVAVDAGTGATGLFEFSATLEPGTYRVEIFASPGDAEKQAPPADDKLITVR